MSGGGGTIKILIKMPRPLDNFIYDEMGNGAADTGAGKFVTPCILMWPIWLREMTIDFSESTNIMSDL